MGVILRLPMFSLLKSRMDHKGVYRKIVREVLVGEADYLNDVTYDPLVL
ncbi:hypothetical protein MCACP_22180 [Neomoorella carbonis]